MQALRKFGTLGIVAFAAACSSGGSTGNDNGNRPNFPQNPGGSPVSNASISVNDNYFSPNSVNLAAGGNVTWNWLGAEGHSVTPESGTSFSPTAPVSFPPKTLVVTFASAGTYRFYCTVHGGDAYGQDAMVGSIFVQ